MSATATEAQAFSNIAATTAAFSLKGGRYIANVVATWGGGNVQLQALGPDGVTWLDPMNIAGTANNFTANGSQTIDLPAGQYRFAVTTATAVYAVIARTLG